MADAPPGDIDRLIDAKLSGWAESLQKAWKKKLTAVTTENVELQKAVSRLTTLVTSFEKKLERMNERSNRVEGNVLALERGFKGMERELLEVKAHCLPDQSQSRNYRGRMNKVDIKVSVPHRRPRSPDSKFQPSRPTSSPSTGGSPRNCSKNNPRSIQRSVSSSPVKNSTRNPYGAGVYCPPRKPSLHIAPSQLSSVYPHACTVPRPSSAPSGTSKKSLKVSSPKHMDFSLKNCDTIEDKIFEVCKQIELVDGKNDKQNVFMLNELIDNMQMMEEKSCVRYEVLENKVERTQNKLDLLDQKFMKMEKRIRKSLQHKFYEIDNDIKAIRSKAEDKFVTVTAQSIQENKLSSNDLITEKSREVIDSFQSNSSIDFSFASLESLNSSLSGKGGASPGAEKEVLMKIFHSTGGNVTWSDDHLWKEDTDLSSWLGVDIDHDHVTGVHLGSNCLSGSIPVEFAQLKMLADLRLFGNNLSGPIPSCFGELPNLQFLILNQNALTGSIPESLSKCSKLEELDLSNNKLTGKIPASLAIQSLNSISLEINNLVGPMPTSFTSLNNLQQLTTDIIPYDEDNFYKVYDYINAHSCLGINNEHEKRANQSDVIRNLGDEQGALLEVLEGFDCEVTADDLQWLKGDSSSPESCNNEDSKWKGVMFDEQGCVHSLVMCFLQLEAASFPEAIEFLSNIVYLDLSDNALRGPLPKSIMNLYHLQYLYLNNNQFEGDITPEIGNLTDLKTLNISGNQLTGQVPSELCGLTSLEVLNISNNNFEGELCQEVCQFSKLRIFDVSSNNLNGSIPDFSEMELLERVSLGGNQFNGHFPDNFGKLRHLRVLDLSFNPICGALPSSLSNLTKLIELDIQMTNVQIDGVDVETRKKLILKRLRTLTRVSL